jgi:hypothetical protein
MSLAIHVTAHCSIDDLEPLIAVVEKAVKDHDAKRAKGVPATTIRVYGNDYSTPNIVVPVERAVTPADK